MPPKAFRYALVKQHPLLESQMQNPLALKGKKRAVDRGLCGRYRGYAGGAGRVRLRPSYFFLEMLGGSSRTKAQDTSATCPLS